MRQWLFPSYSTVQRNELKKHKRCVLNETSCIFYYSLSLTRLPAKTTVIRDGILKNVSRVVQ
jgi:hypothetical protein